MVQSLHGSNRTRLQKEKERTMKEILANAELLENCDTIYANSLVPKKEINTIIKTK